MTTQFTLDERARIRRHLGYPNIQPAAGMSFGIPIPIETLFIVESAIEKIMPEAMNDVRRFVAQLDEVECQMAAARSTLGVSVVDGINIRPDHIPMLENEYTRWQGRLADILGCPVYGFSARGNSSRAGNIPVY